MQSITIHPAGTDTRTVERVTAYGWTMTGRYIGVCRHCGARRIEERDPSGFASNSMCRARADGRLSSRKCGAVSDPRSLAAAAAGMRSVPIASAPAQVETTERAEPRARGGHTMTTRHYGYLYSETEKLSTTDIARRIRSDIKLAQSEGLLPKVWTYSVRTEYFAGGSSIDVTVKKCPDAWQDCDGSVPGSPGHACPNVWCRGRNDPRYAHAAEVHQVLTAEAMAAKVTLERIHGAYNHTGSDITTDYFDVNYYGTVQFDR